MGPVEAGTIASGDADVRLTGQSGIDWAGNSLAVADVNADSTDGAEMADNVIGLLQGDNECTSFEECAELLRNGESIAYRGPSGVTELTEAGDPASGTYEIWRYQDGELSTVETREATVSGSG
ncbi:MAG: hypothetical protein BRC31_07640 [Actinobacteria bacterium QS_5_72_10]|nr:MAG: hypothetical protein BRC31_07640 [Actinobacteria bacterium QS_5_72_10]